MSSATCNQTNNLQRNLIPTTIVMGTKTMNYPHIQPHPITDDDKTRKVPGNCPAAYNPDPSQSVLRRNARERNRVKQVNNSFSRLRQHIPQSIIADLTKGGGRGPQKKISKVDTLRIAVEYIRRLQDLLEDLNGGSSTQQQQQQQFESQNNVNCDSASNSSFSSSLSTGSSSPSSYTTSTATVQYTQSTSPLPTLLDANLQITNINNIYNSSTTLLSPVSLNSYSPPHPHQVVLLENTPCQSPPSSFNSRLSYDSPNFEHNQQQSSVQELQQHFPQNEQTTPPHFDGNLQLKFEPYDNFTLDEEDCTPDDEEILDYISLWQEQ